MSWYNEKESAAYVYDDDEQEYMKYYDVGDGVELTDSQTFYPLQEEDQDLSMIREFGDPEKIHQELEEEKQEEEQQSNSSTKRGSKMSSKAQRILAYVDRLDRVANEIESNHEKYGMPKKAALNLCYRLDKVSDSLEGEAEDAEDEAEEEVEEEDKESIVMEQDPDEPYNEYYDIGGTMDVTQNPDEPYMDWYEEEKGNEFDNPYEGESPEELMGSPSREASTDNWYDSGKKASKNNWYDSGKKASKNNWYD